MLLRLLNTRLRQGYRTQPFPPETTDFPERFRGLPELDAAACADWNAVAAVCPTGCIQVDGEGKPRLDLGRCIFCGDCGKCAGDKAIHFSKDYRQAVFDRKDFVFSRKLERLAVMRRAEVQKIFKRSLRIRLVSAGGCGACESTAGALLSPTWDISRFGMDLVSSPKHADALLIVGPVSGNMKKPMLKVYEAMPEPKLVIACGTCAVSGGIYEGSADCCDGVGKLIPVDMYIPGCPPHPLVLIDGLLRLVGRNKN